MTSAAPAQICANRLKFVRLRSPACCAEACRACVSTALRRGRTCASVMRKSPLAPYVANVNAQAEVNCSADRLI